MVLIHNSLIDIGNYNQQINAVSDRTMCIDGEKTREEVDMTAAMDDYRLAIRQPYLKKSRNEFAAGNA